MSKDFVKRLLDIAGDTNEENETLHEAADRIEELEAALFESVALNINYHAVEEKDGYEFTEAPIVIEMARTVLWKLK